MTLGAMTAKHDALNILKCSRHEIMGSKRSLTATEHSAICTLLHAADYLSYGKYATPAHLNSSKTVSHEIGKLISQ